MYRERTCEMLDFISRSPSCFHAAENLGKMMEEAGFLRLREEEAWNLTPGRGYFVIRNGSAVIGFRVPENPRGGFMIAAAHSDAPALKLKPEPEIRNKNYVQLNVEKYGGAILSTWLDRPLSLAGRAVVETENGVSVRPVCIDRDLALVPNLAIHMNRKVNEGQSFNVQVDMLPLFGLGENGAGVRDLLARELQTEKDSILDFDLFLYLREKGRIWGADEEFVSSPRLDDLQCAWSCTKALIETEEFAGIPVCAVFDNEEVGSRTKQGADSDFLRSVLERISVGMGFDAEKHRAALAQGLMVSADNGHAIHPNHPEKADAVNYPKINGGIVIKYSANQKYTTDAVSAGLLKTLCRREDIPYQSFANRSDVEGGSTLGNISNAQVSMNTVDIGLAQLAMHSAMETGGVMDTEYLIRALRAAYGAGIIRNSDGEYVLL